MRRLYLQIYLTFVGILLIFGVLASIVRFTGLQGPQTRRLLQTFAWISGELLPGPDRPKEELQTALNRYSQHLSTDLALHDVDGSLLAAAGTPLPTPEPDRSTSGIIHSGHSRLAAAIRLPDGRWLMARHRIHPGGHGLGWIANLALMAAAIALGAYPVVRRITGRLERLRVRVEKLGAGALGARIEVEGNDEVADLARCFNKAAERIEHLVNSQRSILAEASHELRSPLTRIRMAIELISEERDPELRERVSRDIADLDELIDELLLASRLEIMDELESTEPIDLVALVAEEAARVGIEIEGEYVQVMGTQSLLRRLVRNLLENARRYGEDTPIELSVLPLGERGAQLTVCDRGPGVSPDERERIFEPFYRPSGTGEKSERGVGLGLALVRRIARHHNGEARCLPRTGGGTCIEVTLQTEESG